jgi:hypothetical protein
VAWLKAWLKDPAKVIAAKDPVATEQLGRFRGLVMPNLGLTDDDISSVIEFMKRSDVNGHSNVAKGESK